MKRTIVLLLILVAAIVILGAAGCNYKSQQTTPSEQTPTAPTTQEKVTAEKTEQAGQTETEKTQKFTIEITSSGFSPAKLTIPVGSKVTFINKDSIAHWPASNVHPTHTFYPGSSIGKCGTAEQSNIFDACHGLAQGEGWSFVFNEKGSWPYHDHLNPSLGGVIEVT